jgi:hypothetical protein
MSPHPMLETPNSPKPASPVVDQPGVHGFFMFGTDTLYLEHMPMFTAQRHMYQVIVRASLPGDVMEKYQAGRKTEPARPYNLVNSGDDEYAIPELKSGARTSYKADIFEDYDTSESMPAGEPFATGVRVQVDQVVHFRSFNLDIPRPKFLNYILFGREGEAHLSHYIATDPDYQHIVTLGTVPDWVSSDQLANGVELTFGALSNAEPPCSDPLTDDSYKVTFQGRDSDELELDLTGATSVWFSTGNLLNESDPC